MDNSKVVKISKRLSYVLRHRPDEIGIQLDAQGWVEVDTLLKQFTSHFFPIDLEELEIVVVENNKKRFAFSEDKTKIRASQGHSVKIELEYEAVEPPMYLFHGTASRYLKSIREKGLIRQNRHHVHLSADESTAKNVGMRHGVPVILKVKTKEMYEIGMEFFVSENEVWLTDHVPVKYLVFPNKGK